MKLLSSTLLVHVLLLFLRLVVAKPLPTDLEEAKSALKGLSTCWDGGECRNPYSCSRNGVIVPCIKIASTGEIVEASTGIIMGYLSSTSTLANGTILLKDFINPNLQHQLEKRHDYVLNCGDNGGPRYRKCSQSPYLYYCRKDGFLWNSGTDNPDCIDNCDCQKVYIKYCPLADNRLVQCVGIPISEVDNPTGTIGDLNQTTALPNGTPSDDNATATPPKREIPEDPQAGVDQMAPEPAVTAPVVLGKRHNYALDCSSASTSVQRECTELGYYCDSGGKVQAQYGRFVSCDIECDCRPLANCLVTRWDVVCLKGKLVANTNDEASETFVAQIIDVTSVQLDNGTVLSDVKWG